MVDEDGSMLASTLASSELYRMMKHHKWVFNVARAWYYFSIFINADFTCSIFKDSPFSVAPVTESMTSLFNSPPVKE
jgi:hypothetical protein